MRKRTLKHPRISRKLLLSMATLTAVGAAVFIIGSARSTPLEAQEENKSTLADRDGQAEPRLVRVIAPERRDFTEYGEYFGEVRGIAQAALSAGTAGRVVALHAREGDLVQKGDSLAEIDPEQAELRYRTALLSEELARESYRREQRFLEQGSSFQVRVDQARLEWLQAQSRLLDTRRLREDSLAITPISGTVVARHIELNDHLEPGDVTFHVADLSRMVVSVGVPEADIAGLRELTRAKVFFSSIPDGSFEGVPRTFSRRKSDRTLTYRVEIEIDNPRGVLLEGQTARVQLELRNHPQAVVVPNRAIFTRGNQSFVMTVEEGVSREQPIQPGPSDKTGTVVLEGLNGDELLVAEGFNRLRHGTRVAIID
ncbi:RND family efflux transporter, MFP subunit [Alkalispirochaeta americana]|uniref:RND family efflux transporter, MFP subunit n=1 Tax=Alkalispirochaeta americana TaxID=159291 RepID=A0A1N6N643_9SPIO|nr:efflux RND transporter periplasmic adaptor subunit [Alkalispirochaeta americana]SIP87554.1 RND family efflux transporter, MFP subunit [Alkalispirochaeta americana]